jgi:hypothetical protein
MGNRPGHILIDSIIEEMNKREPRDEDGLTGPQRRFLRARMFQLSDRAALDEIKASMADLIRWHDEPGFSQAYRALCPTTTPDQVKRGFDAILPEALELMANALKGDELTKSQRWVVDKLLKVTGLDKILIESTTTAIPFEARLALSLHERGLPLPPALHELMLQFFPDRLDALPEGDVVEGEAVTLDSQENSP